MMLELLADSALRSIVLGGGVWLGLKLLRVRSPKLQMTAWTVVLAASLAMPAVTPWLRITLPADPPQNRLVKIAWSNASLLEQPPWRRAAPAGTFAPAGPPKESATKEPAVAAAARQDVAAATPDSQHTDSHRTDSIRTDALDWRALALTAYACVAGAMLFRLLFGWLLMWRIVRMACPVDESWAACTDVRASSVVRVPVTFASTILLPWSYAAWDARRLRAVMLHEGSHVAHGDSYVLLLAAINRAVFWFNPFAWWLLARLADLAEIISDDDAITGLNDRHGYADTLLDVARKAQPLPSGLAMARPGTVRRRVDRILSMTAAPRRIGVRTRAAIAAAIVPMAAISAVTIAHGNAPPRLADHAGPAAPPITNIQTDIAAAQLDRYVGRFAIAPSVLAVTRDGERLFAQLSGEPKLRLVPVNGHEFVDERGDSHLAFVIADEQLAATAVMLRASNFAKRGARIDAARADEIEAAFQQRIAALAQRFRDQTPTPGVKAAVFQMIDDLRHDPPSFERMNPQLADRLRRQLPQLRPALEALGPPEQAFFRGVAPYGHDIYAVKFANGSGEFRIELAADGTIFDANVRPDGDGNPGGTVDCAREPTLKATDGAAPIMLTLRNFTGGDGRLFSLDAAGRRAAVGELPRDRSTDVLTAVGRPLVVADGDGRCRQIVLPGQQTRFHAVERPGALQGPSDAWRNTPVAGSEEALRQYLDSIRRGLPDYGRMTPEAAAVTRQLLPQQRAILARLGALRVISFRNVGPTGDDLYALRFAEGAAMWQIGFADDGRIRSVWLSPG